MRLAKSILVMLASVISILVAQMQSLHAQELSDKNDTAVENVTALRSVEAIHRVDSADLLKGLPVDLECIVMVYEPDWAILFVHDGQKGLYAGNPRGLNLKRGDRIRILGELGPYRFPVNATYASSNNLIELPVPKAVDFDWLQSGREDSQLVEIEGQMVGIDSDHHQTTLEMRAPEGGRFRGLIHDSRVKMDTLRGMLGKKLRLRGVAGARFDEKQRLIGFQIWLGNPLNIVELENPGEPFAMPLTPISGLTENAIIDTKSTYFRTTGTLTHQLSHSMVLLEDETDQLFVELSKTDNYALDQAFDVTGTLDTSVSPPVLRMAELAPIANPLRSPRRVAPFQSIVDLVAGEFSGKLVRTSGSYSGPIEIRGQKGFLLRSGGNLVPVFLNDGTLGNVSLGTSVEVQGIWIQQLSLVGFSMGSNSLHARMGGITLGTQIPWLLVSLLAIAGTIAGVSSVWVMTLRRLVRSRTKQFLDSVALQRRMEEQYANIFINARVMVITTDAAGKITAVNPATIRTTCRNEASLIGEEVFELVEHDSQGTLRALLLDALHSDQIKSCQVKLIGADGVFIPQEVSCWGTQSDGASTLHLIWHDISKRLQMEEEHAVMERQMRSMQKMESLGALAGGIAHDFNNLLTVIVGHASLLATSSSIQPYELDSVNSIEQAATRAAELTQQMLAYAGRGRFDIRVVDVSKLVAEMSQLLVASASKNTQVLFSLQDDLPGVKADATQLKQILMNLVRNASEAMEGRVGQIRVSTFASIPSQALPAAQSHSVSFYDKPQDEAPSRFTCLEVSDDGVGIDEPNLARIFDPFFTTKFSGRGLGLSTVIGIVKAHHGFLQVESRREIGTTFRIYLPTCQEPVTPTPVPRHHSLQNVTPAHVIVVDDESPVLIVMAKNLERAGFKVTKCSSGKEAFATLQDLSVHIDCLITDQTMPEMTGLELCQLAHQVRPELPIILCSGYSLDLATSPEKPPGVRAVLQKPYPSAELINLILKLLDEERSAHSVL